jgi:hypothetical protein
VFQPRFVAAILLLGPILVIGVAAFCDSPSDSRSPPKVSSFVWDFDSSEGVAVTLPLQFAPDSGHAHRSVKMSVELSPEISKGWEVRKLVAYQLNGDGRSRLVDEGPFPLSIVNAIREVPRSWSLHNVADGPYEIDCLLRRVEDGMSASRLCRAIQTGQTARVEVNVVPLTESDLRMPRDDASFVLHPHDESPVRIHIIDVSDIDDMKPVPWVTVKACVEPVVREPTMIVLGVSDEFGTIDLRMDYVHGKLLVFDEGTNGGDPEPHETIEPSKLDVVLETDSYKQLDDSIKWIGQKPSRDTFIRVYNPHSSAGAYYSWYKKEKGSLEDYFREEMTRVTSADRTTEYVHSMLKPSSTKYRPVDEITVYPGRRRAGLQPLHERRRILGIPLPFDDLCWGAEYEPGITQVRRYWIEQDATPYPSSSAPSVGATTGNPLAARTAHWPIGP